MELFRIIEVIIVVICAVTYSFMLYFEVRGNVIGAVSELIALAESTGKTGSDKMAQVVRALSEKVPRPLRSIFNKKRLEKTAQHIFDWMRKYSNEYQKSKQEDEHPEMLKEEIAAEISGTATKLITELLKLTVGELKAKAESSGIDLDGVTKKDDIVRVIVENLLTK